MDLNFSAEHEAFRREVVNFLAAHAHEAPEGHERHGQGPDG